MEKIKQRLKAFIQDGKDAIFFLGKPNKNKAKQKHKGCLAVQKAANLWGLSALSCHDYFRGAHILMGYPGQQHIDCEWDIDD